ncbi:hypothetical protein [Geitlerinema sp. PCC 7407]|uniref:hypothetical protein n=1 Tax=Geitlerinema sp. PCC 7407 TaxID=1173025 RepID=UPI00029FB90A|nr:hypothetical protein [Geitlerinema sp. PCC 7407]AFY64691.1 hypothetical protein GEI7407_0186 [Geitlerinema sp. PCC 7407]
MTQQLSPAELTEAKEIFGILSEALCTAATLLAHVTPGEAGNWGRFLLLCGAAAHRQIPPEDQEDRAHLLIDQIVRIPEGIPSTEELNAILAELQSPTEN